MDRIKMKDRKGFGLVELLVALSIMAIFLSVPLFDTAMRVNVKVRNLNNARFIAERFMEIVRSYEFTNSALLDDGDASDLADTTNFDHQLPPDTVQATGIVYNIGYNIADGVPSTNTKTIRAFVRWNDKLGRHEITYTTVKVNVNY